MFDLMILGGGPGGYTAALESVKLGKKVLIIEEDEMGGVCLNKGCIPTKSLLNSAKTFKKSVHSEHIGVVNSLSTFKFDKAMEWKNLAVTDIRNSLISLLKQKGIEIVKGHGVILDKNRIQVEQKIYSGEFILISTGSRPSVPKIKGISSKNVLSTTQILELKKIPESITIIGGGVIGVEFASIFSNIGVDVKILELSSNLIPNMEERLGKVLGKSLNAQIYLEAEVLEIDSNRVFFKYKNNMEYIDSQYILIATGRTPNCDEFKHLGIVNNGRVEVNDYFKTSINNIYAVGDVTGKTYLAHGAEQMAKFAINNIFFEPKIMNFNIIPSVIYSEPEVASVGLSIKQAKERDISIVKNVLYLKSNGRYRVEDGFDGGICIVIGDKDSHKILGIHIIGSGVSEIISIATIAITEGYDFKRFQEIIFPHPTISESIKDTIFNII
ncbi:MAG: dihydrolipoyl dehydrogenase [Spirochaetales bacterium]|nr:dihydrolipoyl dehydrogenase [Spirochaetales bacterium]